MPEWTVDEARAGARADVFLAEVMGCTRGEAQRLIEARAATVDGAAVRSNRRLRAGDLVAVARPAPAPARTEPEQIPIPVVYEDADLLVVDKPRGMVVHPAPGAESGTLVNAVLAYADDLSGIGGELRPGIVHRLDKDTSGLLVVAKSDTAHQSLQAQIQAHTAERRYLAVVWGSPTFERATVEAPIGRDPHDRKRMAVITDPAYRARDAVTELTVRERLGPFTLLEARLRTGRTHQIRVHAAYVGHPVVGDAVYRGQRKVPAEDVPVAGRARVQAAIGALHGQALHAYSLSFDHPSTGERMTFEAAMPGVMQGLVDALRDVYGGRTDDG